MVKIFFIFILVLLLNACNGKKEWNRPNDGKARLVKGNDGVQTIVFESPTDGVWEIGNGEIWHKPVGGAAKNVTGEFVPIPADYIEKKKKELTGGSIRVQGDPIGSIRPAGNKSGGGSGSIRPPPPGAPGSGSIRTQPSGSIRGGSGKKLWNRPNDGKARLVKGNDGVQTIVFESPTDGVWEIGNGEIWHKPVGGAAKNVTGEFVPIPADYIEKKKKELTGGSIRVQGDPIGSIRPAGNKSGGGSCSIRLEGASGAAFPSGSIRPESTEKSGSIRNTSVPASGSIRLPPKVPIKQSDLHVKAGRTVRPDAPIKVKSDQKSGSIRSDNSKPAAAAPSAPSNSAAGGGFFDNLMDMFKLGGDSGGSPPPQRGQKTTAGYGDSQFEDLSGQMLLDLSSSVNMPIVARFLHAIGDFLAQKDIDPITKKFAGPFLDDVMDRDARQKFLQILSIYQVDEQLYKMVYSIFIDRVEKLRTPKMQSRLACWLLARILQELVDGVEQQQQEGGGVQSQWSENRINSELVRKRIKEVLDDNKINMTDEENQQMTQMQNLALIDMGRSIRMKKEGRKK